MTKIPIVLCFDSRIILGASITIKSMIDNANKETCYDIRIFHSDLNEKTQDNLKKLILNTKHSMQFHYINPSRFKNAPKNKGSWTEIVYYRLLIPDVLREYDKAIYSDVDVFIKGDLTELYNIDLDGYECGAIPSESNSYLKECKSKRYFEENSKEKNYWSGLLLFNNKAARENNFTERVFETIEKYKTRLVYFDLDTFNLTCDKIKDLPLAYCVLETLYTYSDVKLIPEYNDLNKIYTDEELKKAKNNPQIIHYAGRLGKPWRRKWVPDYYKNYIDNLPKELVKYTFRDFRKKIFSKPKYPI